MLSSIVAPPRWLTAPASNRNNHTRIEGRWPRVRDFAPALRRQGFLVGRGLEKDATEALHVTERFPRNYFGRMSIQIAIELGRA